MNLHKHDIGESLDFLRKSTMWLAFAALALLTPFSINNFVQGRYLLGAGSLVVVAIIGFAAWSTRRGRYPAMLTLGGLVPAIILFLVISLRDQGFVGVMWCYPAVVSFYVILPERKAWMANIALLLITFPQAWAVIEHPLAARMMVTLIGVSIFTAIFIRVITEQQSKLHLMATTDPLTGLYNRTLLYETLDQAIERNSRTGAPMTLIVFDLDHFKKINDTLGHDAGDSALRKIGELLRSRLRRLDKVFRMGGEEFLALLGDTDIELGRQVAEELRSTIDSTALLPERNLTVSIGAATLRAGETPRDWMKRADDNLYQAKMQGRNQVVV